MRVSDYLILAGLGYWFLAAVCSVLKGRKHGCSRDCAHCRGCDKK